ncbi:hypothetical protein [Streptomyces sp. NPDC057623]|uniref:hypothetical protein n=1 Tax=Streptomyces sp. NPDC057623 TaxID=3346187 RepID=UPI003683B475
MTSAESRPFTDRASQTLTTSRGLAELMPTYEQLYHLKLSNLKAAAERWEETVTKFKGLHSAYGDQVVRPFRQAGWSQPVLTAAMADKNVRDAQKEFEDAHKEAKGIAGVLKTLHAELKKAKDDLHHLAESEAKAQDLHVSPTGVVTPRNDLSQTSARHDPDGQALIREQDEACDAFARRIERVLQGAADADETACWALRRDLGGNKTDFNSKVVTSLDDADATRALALANKGSDMSDRELRQLNKLLRANKDDEEFAEKFATSLGGRGTLEFWADMADPARNSTDSTRPEREKLLAELQKDLGETLGTATHSDSKEMQDWKKEVIRLGPRELGIEDASNPAGFQVASSLMRFGEYEPRFMEDYGKALIATDKSFGKDVEAGWYGDNTLGRLNFAGGDNEGNTDPMTGYMEGLGRCPEAATNIFANDEYFKYLTEDRKWFQDQQYLVHDPETFERIPGPITGYNQLGHALEAATTGHAYDEAPPKDLPAHSDQQAEIMQKIVNGVSMDPEMARDGMHDSLGRMSAEYMPDFSRAMSNDPSPDRLDLFPVEGVQANFGEQDATRFLMTVGTDPDGYAAVNLGQTAYAANLYDYHLKHPDAYGPDTDQAVQDIAHSSGEIQGTIAIGRQESEIGDAVEADKKYNDALERKGAWASGIVGTGIGVGTSFIATPAAGAAVGGIATTISGDIVSQIIDGKEQNTTGKVVYSTGLDWQGVKDSTSQLNQDAARAAAEAHGISNTDNFNSVIAEGATAGIVEAQGNLPGYGRDFGAESRG